MSEAFAHDTALNADHSACVARNTKKGAKVGLLGCLAATVLTSGWGSALVCGGSTLVGASMEKKCGAPPAVRTVPELEAFALDKLALAEKPLCTTTSTTHGTGSDAIVRVRAASSPADSLAALGDAMRRDAGTLQALKEQSFFLSARSRRLIDEFGMSTARFEAAASRWERASAIYDESSTSFVDAERDYREAEQQFRITATIIALGMASGQVCGSTMTTSEYRKRLKAEGIDLTGMDIDHVFPRSAGGVDHAWNYQVLDSSLNRSLGADLYRKLMQAPIGIIAGFATSALARLGGC